MGSTISSLFGGYEAPDPVEYDPAPTRNDVEPVSKSAREEERRKIRARRGMSGNLLTSPLGTGNGAQSGASAAGSGLLGRV